MVKATLRSAVLLGLLAVTSPSFAEVQNVKVGGDVTVRGVLRNNLDLHDESGSNTQGLDREDYVFQTTGLNVSADLSENVSAFVRLANERDWNLVGASNNVALSQGYVTFKELFYSPLTVKIGTQPIWWGRGFILGSGLFPNVNGLGDDRNSAISANEYTDFTAFDAFRATLDLSNLGGMSLPLTADYVYIKSDENAVGSSDDVNIQGINLGTKLSNSEVEAYFLNKRDRAAATATNDNQGSVNTLGIRGSAQPMAGTSVYGELAYQFGQRVTDPSGTLRAGDAHQAWAANLGAEYTAASVASKPMVGGEWRFYSGHKSALNGAAVGGWAPIAPGYFTTALREFQTQSTVAGFYPVDQAALTSAGTNQNQLALYGALTPIEDLKIAPRLSWFFLDTGFKPNPGDGTRKGYVGMEWDTSLTYDYTDDVQFGLLYALFAPGNVFRTPNDSTAQELVSSVSVKF